MKPVPRSILSLVFIPAYLIFLLAVILPGGGGLVGAFSIHPDITYPIILFLFSVMAVGGAIVNYRRKRVSAWLIDVLIAGLTLLFLLGITWVKSFWFGNPLFYLLTILGTMALAQRYFRLRLKRGMDVVASFLIVPIVLGLMFMGGKILPILSGSGGYFWGAGTPLILWTVSALALLIIIFSFARGNIVGIREQETVWWEKTLVLWFAVSLVLIGYLERPEFLWFAISEVLFSSPVTFLLLFALVAFGILYLIFSRPATSLERSYRFGRLYFRTLLSDVPGALVRAFLLFLLLGLFALIFVLARAGGGDFQGIGDTLGQAGLVVFILSGLWGFWPLMRSIAASMFGSDIGLETVDALGAREPTRDELGKIIDCLEQIAGKVEEDIPVPTRWLVIDSPLVDSYTIGYTVFLTRELVNSEHLTGVMAHEMGHLSNRDGVRLLTLRKLVPKFAYHWGIDIQARPAGVVAGGQTLQQEIIRSPDEQLESRIRALWITTWFTSLFGGAGLVRFAREWAAYWRGQDFKADEFVVRLGFEAELLEMLEQHQVFDIAQPFMLRGRPYTAERIDRLKG